MTEQTGGGPTGIGLEITWAVAQAELVIERDTSGGFGGAVEIARLDTPTNEYTDVLPIDGVTYHYRSRHEQIGQTESAWSSGVSDTPHEL